MNLVSLRVSFLAGKVLDTLEKNGTPIDEYDRMCVTIAALCHDIGHGPFSHLYEDVAKAIDGKKWKGKAVQTVDKTTKEITDEMTDEERKKAFLYQIVNNEDNGVDVDKWDYFTRDSHACGFPSNFDTDRAIAMVRVRELKLEGEKTANVLSFPKKDEINLYNMFGLRYTLHSKVYKHQVVICVGEIKFITTKNCRQQKAVDEYCLMDDRLIYLIYNTEKTGENVAKARKIIDRIHRRDFYKCVFERTLPKVNLV
ncbi:hypothetical protein KUTeg_015265 [Tegillarca granosa]|uniref:HD domain-containing protein n=1 Tax=Tegillarca granosa TaxID=220873 RepID=A0ABQ9ET90_TEGGR|nr:hypothetical protein KUTeg_015265 [Tegillarca granosa]